MNTIPDRTRTLLEAALKGEQFQALGWVSDKWIDCDSILALQWIIYELTNSAYDGRIRIKSEVLCEIAGIKFPLPMQEVPEYDTEIWIAQANGEPILWDGSNLDKLDQLIFSNLCHTAYTAAKEHSRALSEVSKAAINKVTK